MAYRLILYEKSPPIGRVILNQPHKLNPLSNALRDEFEATLRSGRPIVVPDVGGALFAWPRTADRAAAVARILIRPGAANALSGAPIWRIH